MTREVRPTGTLIRGKWRIASVLRGGHAGALYLATNRTGAVVPLKIAHPSFAKDVQLEKRFREEADISGRIDHPGVARVLDEDRADDGAPLLLLEPLDGETISARQQRVAGAMALEDVFDVVDLLLEVLGAAHAASVMHFDLTPENLMLTDLGLLKVLDFGALDGRGTTREQRKKRSSHWPPAFTAPELLLDETADVRSDIWAVGSLLYTLVTGVTARSVDAQADMVASVPVRVLKNAGLDLPPAFVNIVDRALAFDRVDRWPNVEAMSQALKWARRTLDPEWAGAAGLGPGQRGSEPPTEARPSRSALVQQARESRQRAGAKKPNDGPPSAPTLVETAVSLLAKQKSRESEVPPPPRPRQPSAPPSSRRSTLESAGNEAMRLHPRYASEPTLPSAPPSGDSEHASKRAPRGIDHLISEAPPPPPRPTPRKLEDADTVHDSPLIDLPTSATGTTSGFEDAQTVVRTPKSLPPEALRSDPDLPSPSKAAPAPATLPNKVPAAPKPSLFPGPTQSFSSMVVLGAALLAALTLITVLLWPRGKKPVQVTTIASASASPSPSPSAVPSPSPVDSVVDLEDDAGPER